MHSECAGAGHSAVPQAPQGDVTHREGGGDSGVHPLSLISKFLLLYHCRNGDGVL